MTNAHVQCRCGLVLEADLAMPTGQATTTGQETCSCGEVYDLAIEHLTGTGAEARYEFRVRMKAAEKHAWTPQVPA